MKKTFYTNRKIEVELGDFINFIKEVGNDKFMKKDRIFLLDRNNNNKIIVEFILK